MILMKKLLSLFAAAVLTVLIVSACTPTQQPTGDPSQNGGNHTTYTPKVMPND